MFQPDDIVTHREFCDFEGLGQGQRGMTFRPPPNVGVILMSQRANAPYADILDDDGNLLYEGHDARRGPGVGDPKRIDQPLQSTTGRPTENGKFVEWTDRYKAGEFGPAQFHVYEKLHKGVWTFRGRFQLIDYRWVLDEDNDREVLKFVLNFAGGMLAGISTAPIEVRPPRQIPSDVKAAVYRRDKGRCVICSSETQLHFDHNLPVAKGGNATVENIRILCARHNLAKGAKIE